MESVVVCLRCVVLKACSSFALVERVLGGAASRHRTELCISSLSNPCTALRGLQVWAVGSGVTWMAAFRAQQRSVFGLQDSESRAQVARMLRPGLLGTAQRHSSRCVPPS